MLPEYLTIIWNREEIGYANCEDCFQKNSLKSYVIKIWTIFEFQMKERVSDKAASLLTEWLNIDLFIDSIN